METIEEQIINQRRFFQTEGTLPYSYRKEQLEKLKNMLKTYEDDIYQALHIDLNKSAHETFLTEIGFLYTEIDFTLKHLSHWMDTEKVSTPITHKGTKNYIYKEPFGVALIIAPWNYPLQLAIAPAIGAIAAGNCVTLKPSEHAQATSTLLKKMIQSTFNSNFFNVIEGEKETSELLLEQRFDYIFFTGSTNVGRIIMEKASRYLTPVTLELGGKSPAIVDIDANINLAAKRIVWGKFTNAGQTCVAPDYLYVHAKIKKKLIKAMIKYIRSFYGKDPIKNNDYVHIINKPHFDRLEKLKQCGTTLYGGQSCTTTLAMEPTLIDNISGSEPIMQEEIFGPLLPILTFTNLDDVIEDIQEQEKPLALYYFGVNKTNQEKVLRRLSFGGGCINDTLYHLANPHLPFGGVGNSGTGAYHGKYSFDTFSHSKSIMKQTNKFDLPFRYPVSKLAHFVVKKIIR